MPSSDRTAQAGPPGGSSVWRQETGAVVTAFAFLTRLPLPRVLPGPGAVERAVGWLPLVGIFVGGVSAVAFLLAAWLWQSPWIAAVAAVAASVLVTGGFHEDGLADTADAFAAGGDRQRMLAVLDDPRIGAVGAVALVLTLFARVAALAALPALVAAGALVAAHALGRWSIPALLWTSPYVRGEAGIAARLKAGATGGRLALATLLALASLLALVGWGGRPLGARLMAVLVLAGTALVVTLGAQALFRRKLGGVTGDLLGAGCQAVELAVLLAVLAIVE